MARKRDPNKLTVPQLRVLTRIRTRGGIACVETAPEGGEERWYTLDGKPLPIRSTMALIEKGVIVPIDRGLLDDKPQQYAEPRAA